MKIDYKLMREDYISFSIHHAENSKTVKKSLFIQRYIVPIIFLIAPFILINVTDVPFLFWLVPYLLIYILWVIFYPKRFKRRMRRQLEKILQEGKNENLFSSVTLSLDETGIIEASKKGEFRVNWSSIENVEETKDHIFMYTSSVEGVIVPKRAFVDVNQKSQFLRELENYRNKLRQV